MNSKTKKTVPKPKFLNEKIYCKLLFYFTSKSALFKATKRKKPKMSKMYRNVKILKM